MTQGSINFPEHITQSAHLDWHEDHSFPNARRIRYDVDMEQEVTMSLAGTRTDSPLVVNRYSQLNLGSSTVL